MGRAGGARGWRGAANSLPRAGASPPRPRRPCWASLTAHFGPGMFIVSADVGGNIDRLAAACGGGGESVTEVVAADVARGGGTGPTSTAAALLWLLRTMLFVAALLRALETDRGASVADAARGAYGATLRPYHGLLTRTAFAAALYCAPTRVKFFAATGAATEAAALADVGGCLVEWEGVLADLHAWMDGTGLNSQARV